MFPHGLGQPLAQDVVWYLLGIKGMRPHNDLLQQICHWSSFLS